MNPGASSSLQMGPKLVFVSSSSEGPHGRAFQKQLISGISDLNTSDSGLLLIFIYEEIHLRKILKLNSIDRIQDHTCNLSLKGS